jgi:hypothetical protein
MEKPRQQGLEIRIRLILSSETRRRPHAHRQAKDRLEDDFGKNNALQNYTEESDDILHVIL